MEYIVITLLAIAATTCVVYLLANKVFGVRLRLKSLVLCAACALFLSLVLPRIVVSFAGLAGTVGFLAVFAVIFAYFVAYYDNPRDLPASPVSALPAPPAEPQGDGAALVSAAATFIAAGHGEDQEQKITTDEPTGPPTAALVDLFPPTAATISEPETEPEPESALSVLDIDLELSLIAASEPAPDGEPDDKEAAPLTILPAAAPAAEIEPEPSAAAETEPEAELIAEPADEAAGPGEVTADPLAAFAFTDDISPEPPAESDAAAEIEQTDAADAPENDIQPMEANEVTIPSHPASDSLDDLMDFAFTQKETGHHQQALDAFRRALRLYRFSEAAPFLAIEIANLLKNRGSYDEAIAVLSESRSLLALLENEALDQEFVVTIAYLRIVKNTLLQKRVGYLPFSRIPADISREIDAEFREWRNLA